MVDDIDTKIGRGHVEVRTGIGHLRNWSDEEKDEIVAEAVAPGAVVSEVTRRHDLTPQHLFGWIRSAKDGKFAPPAEAGPAFVPVVMEGTEPKMVMPSEHPASIVSWIGDVRVRATISNVSSTSWRSKPHKIWIYDKRKSPAAPSAPESCGNLGTYAHPRTDLITGPCVSKDLCPRIRPKRGDTF